MEQGPGVETDVVAMGGAQNVEALQKAILDVEHVVKELSLEIGSSTLFYRYLKRLLCRLPIIGRNLKRGWSGRLRSWSAGRGGGLGSGLCCVERPD